MTFELMKNKIKFIILEPLNFGTLVLVMYVGVAHPEKR